MDIHKNNFVIIMWSKFVKLPWKRILLGGMFCFIVSYYIYILARWIEDNNIISPDAGSNSYQVNLQIIENAVLCIVIYFLRNTGSIVLYLFRLFLIITIFITYLSINKYCTTPVCLANPLTFIPLLLIFLILIKRFEHLYNMFTFIIMICISIIFVDDILNRIKVFNFQKFCHNIEDDNEINRIYINEHFSQWLKDEAYSDISVVNEISLCPSQELCLLRKSCHQYSINNDSQTTDNKILCFDYAGNKVNIYIIAEYGSLVKIAEIFNHEVFYANSWLFRFFDMEGIRYKCGDKTANLPYTTLFKLKNIINNKISTINHQENNNE